MRLFALFILTIVGNSVFSQITIDSTDIAVAGDTFTVAVGQNPSVIDVTGGAGHSWDFSNLQLDSLDPVYTRSINTAQYPQDTLFPGSNLYMQSTSYGYSYMIKSQSSLLMAGQSNIEFLPGYSFSINFDTNLTLMEFPLNFNDKFFSSTTLDTVVDTTLLTFDSIRIKVILSADIDVEGHGTLKTIQGTYNTLKLYSQEVQGYDVFGHLPVTGQWLSTPFLSERDTVHKYRWFAKGEGYQVAEATADDKNGTSIYASFLLTDSLFAYISDSINPSCNGLSDGEAEVTPIGGSGNYSYKWSHNGSAQGARVTGLPAGIYNVTVTDILTNDTIVNIVSLEDPDTLGIIAVTLQDEGPAPNSGVIEIMVSGGTQPYSYQWDNSSSTDKIANDLAGGNHTVTVTDANNCTKDTTMSIGSTVGINTFGNNGEVVIYPNPASEEIHIQSNADLVSIEIVDQNGKLLISSESSIVNISHLESGVYIVIANTKQSQLTQTLIKQ